MTHKGGQPTTEKGVVEVPVLSLFQESDLPSAHQTGLLIAVDDGAGNVKLGLSREGSWFLFAHDTIVS